MSIVFAGLLFLLMLAWVMGQARKSNSGRWLSRDLNQFLLWNQKVRWFLLGSSYAASMVSAMVFIPLPGLFYTHGIGAWLFICLPVIFGVSSFLWFGGRLRRLQNRARDPIISPFELVGFAYGSKRLGALIFLYTAIFVIPLIAMQIVSFGRLLEGLLALPYHISLVILVIIFVGYTIFSGMEGDVRTDSVQGFAMLLGLILVAYISVKAFLEQGGTLDSALVRPNLNIPGPNGYFTVETLVSVGVTMAALPLVNGHYIMRFMIAKDTDELRKAMYVAPVFIFSWYFLAAVIGITGLISVPGLTSGDLLTGTLLKSQEQYLWGAIAGGVVLFGILSASLSSVDSQFLALGAGASRDVFNNFFGYQLSDSEQIKLVRVVMVVIGIAAIVMAVNPPRLVIQLNVLAAAGPMVLLPTALCGVLWPQTLRSWVPTASIIIGGVCFVVLHAIYGNDGLGGWSAGFISGLAAIMIFAIGAGLDRMLNRVAY
jgi:solute:Na+ symporter, SSS family